MLMGAFQVGTDITAVEFADVELDTVAFIEDELYGLVELYVSSNGSITAVGSDINN